MTHNIRGYNDNRHGPANIPNAHYPNSPGGYGHTPNPGMNGKVGLLPRLCPLSQQHYGPMNKRVVVHHYAERSAAPLHCCKYVPYPKYGEPTMALNNFEKVQALMTVPMAQAPNVVPVQDCYRRHPHHRRLDGVVH